MRLFAALLLLPFAAILYTWWIQGKMNRYARQQLMSGGSAALTS